MNIILLSATTVALIVIAGLAFYAGKLLFKLKEQTQRQQKARNARIETITESIQTIAFAMKQQQCNLSEGAIRLVNLLQALPLDTPVDVPVAYPSLFALYEEVKDLPTHKVRAALPKEVRMQQDKVREEHEARLESSILKEIEPLRQYSAI